ncbi:4Fe-4S binding protein [Schnuerera sp.]|uniref:4Fe-4S binding protein n=1 Tax=Schnuerera sp. TaxID=2794844 RepID=UPI002CA5F435|nr:4Fe-4S binding protein [Schnuerera sp.]HSH34831.1 4Fe-4S binding protein [Schnuerera sp.]
MKYKKRSFIQIAFTIFVILISIIYSLYINGIIDWRMLSIGDINPYGGWSALKSALTDPSYRWRGVTKSIALTIGIFITALLMGRFFCGFICPIGALQDFFKFLGTKLGIKERNLAKGKFFNPEILKYFVLLMVLILSILGLGNIISPYSPWVAYLNVFLGLNFQRGFIVLLLVALFSLFVKRVFCRFFCPLGAFQSLLSVLGPSKISSNERCNGCNYCLRNCPVNIKRPHNLEISPECIRCLECVESQCIKGRDGYSLKFGKFRMNESQYITISLILLIGIYLLLPLIQPQTSPQSIVDLDFLKDGTYIGRGIGFGGTMQVEVIIENNRIIGINPINHSETTGYYEEVFRTIPLEIIETQSLNIDGISGATATSRGFINGVKSGISQALERK